MVTECYTEPLALYIVLFCAWPTTCLPFPAYIDDDPPFRHYFPTQIYEPTITKSASPNLLTAGLISMEFKFRAVDDRPSSSTVRYFSSERTIRGQSVLPTWALSPPPPCLFPNSDSRTSPDPNPDSITIHDPILHPTNARDAIQRQLEKDRIREEILAAEIARRRVLEAEVRRELRLEREIAMRRAAGDELGFEDPFGPMPFAPRLPQAHSLDHRFAFGSPSTSPLPMVPLNLNLNLEVNKELNPPARPSNLNKDKLIVLAKPNPNLSGVKRKTPPTKGANELPPSRLKKMPREEWSCALCQVTTTNEKVFDGHLNGKKHKARVKKLRTENLGKSSSNAPLSENTAKLFEPKELEINGTECSELGAKEARDGLDKKMQDTNTSKEKTSKEKKEELPVQKDQCREDLTNNVGVKTVHMLQRKEEPTKRRKFEFLCEICRVGSHNPKVMENHKRGKKHMARLKELTKNRVRTTDVTKEANVNTPTTNSMASSGATQEAVNSRLQRDSENNAAHDNVIKEANATIPTTIAVASLVATEKAENARLQESIHVTKEANVGIPTAVAVASWGASEEAETRLLEEFIKNDVPTTNGTKEANPNIPTTTSVALASSWAIEAAENLRKLEAYEKLIKARLTE